MPRSLRIEFPGAIYHVMSRGDRRENIYLDDDRQEFIKTLAEACLKTGWQIHAFCLVGNHKATTERPGKTGDGDKNPQGNHFANADDCPTCGIGRNHRRQRESASVEKTGENLTCKKINC